MSASRAKNRSINKPVGEASLGNLSELLENVTAGVIVTGAGDPAEPLLWGVPAFAIRGMALSKSSPNCRLLLVPRRSTGAGHPKAGAGEGILHPTAAGAVLGDAAGRSWWALVGIWSGGTNFPPKPISLGALGEGWGWDERQGWVFCRHVRCSGRRLHARLLPTLMQGGISSCQSGVLSVCAPTQASIKIQAGSNVCQSPAAEARAPGAARCPGTPRPGREGWEWSLKCAA